MIKISKRSSPGKVPLYEVTETFYFDDGNIGIITSNTPDLAPLLSDRLWVVVFSQNGGCTINHYDNDLLVTPIESINITVGE